MFTQHTKPFPLTCAERLAHYMRHHFDPRRDESWEAADRLWRAALLTRDVQADLPELPMLLRRQAS